MHVEVPARTETRLDGHKQALRTKDNLLSRVGGVYWVLQGITLDSALLNYFINDLDKGGKCVKRHANLNHRY